MTVLSIDLAGNPVLGQIISNCRERVEHVSELDKRASVVKRKDFVAPFSQAILAGMQSGESGHNKIAKLVKRSTLRNYLGLIESNDPMLLREARHVLYNIFNSAYELGKEFREARRKVSGNLVVETGAPEVGRYFVSMLAEELGLKSGDYDALAREVWRMYQHKETRLFYH